MLKSEIKMLWELVLNRYNTIGVYQAFVFSLWSCKFLIAVKLSNVASYIHKKLSIYITNLKKN